MQKYYLSFRESPEHGAVYVWDSDESLRRFRKSELAGTIPSIYRIQGTADIHDADVVLELWPHVASELHQRDQENRPNR